MQARFIVKRKGDVLFETNKLREAYWFACSYPRKVKVKVVFQASRARG